MSYGLVMLLNDDGLVFVSENIFFVETHGGNTHISCFEISNNALHHYGTKYVPNIELVFGTARDLHVHYQLGILFLSAENENKMNVYDLVKDSDLYNNTPLHFDNLPVAPTGVEGDVYSNVGVLTIDPGP